MARNENNLAVPHSLAVSQSE